MDKIKARLHMHNHSGPGGQAYILGDRAGLKALGESLIKASRSVLGLEDIELYTSDGHRYTLVVTCALSEEEWQNLPPPHSSTHKPDSIEIIQEYNGYMQARG